MRRRVRVDLAPVVSAPDHGGIAHDDRADRDVFVRKRGTRLREREVHVAVVVADAWQGVVAEERLSH